MSFDPFDLPVPTWKDVEELTGITPKIINDSINLMYHSIPSGDKRWDILTRAMNTLEIGFLRKQISRDGFRL